MVERICLSPSYLESPVGTEALCPLELAHLKMDGKKKKRGWESRQQRKAARSGDGRGVSAGGEVCRISESAEKVRRPFDRRLDESVN